MDGIYGVYSWVIVPPDHPHEAERLALLQRCGILDTAEDASFDGLVQLASSIAGMPIALVSLVDSKRQWFKAHHGLDARETPREMAFCAHAILDPDHVLLVEDARRDPRFAGNPLVEGEPHVQCYAGVPLRVGNDRQPLGTLCVIDHQPRSISPSVIEQLQLLAHQVEKLIESQLRQRALEEALIAKAKSDVRAELLTKVAAQVPGMVYQFVLMPDGTTRFPYSSAGIEVVYGVTPKEAEVSAHMVISRLHPDDHERVMESISQSAKLLALWSCEYRYCHPNGNVLWLQGRASPERQQDGSTLWHGFITDVTERKKQDALSGQQAEFMRLATTTAGIGMWIYDSDLQRLHWDDRMLEMYGYGKHEFMGVYGNWADRIHPDDRALAERQIVESLANREPFRSRFRLLLPDETIRHITASAAILANDLGHITGMVGVNLDITEQVVREERLRDTLAELKASEAIALQARDIAEAASRTKADFLATMSHEIRTPMNGVIGMTSLLLNTKLSGDQREYINSIRISGDALLSIINDILDFSKIEAGKLEIEPIRFDLRSAAEDVIELLSVKASEKGIDLLLDCPANVECQLVGDEGRVRQILLNLVGNALKFTAVGSVVLRIESIEQSSSLSRLRMTVSDTGIGIGPEHLERLFTPFTQADASTSRRFGGTGLGLAICSRLCALMRGTISVSSRVGEGSHFVLELPFEPDLSVSKVDSLRVCDGLPVLVVSDGQASGEVIVRMLETWGLPVTTVSDARAAADILSASSSLHVLLFDHRECARSEAGFAEFLAHGGGRQHLAVAVISQANPGDADRLKEQGFRAYLARPIRMATLHYTCEALKHQKTTWAPFITKQTISEILHAHMCIHQPVRDESHPLRVLLAEDNSINQKVVINMLKVHHCLVDVAGNGIEAVEMSNRSQYDFILMDCQMPDMDGFEATKVIRHGNGPSKYVPIIALTASAMQGDRESCLAAGMSDYLSKPITPTNLGSMVARWSANNISNVEDSLVTVSELPDTQVLDDLLKMAGDRAVIAAIIHDFIEQAQAAGPSLSESLQRGDHAAAREILHRLKGSSGALELTALEAATSAAEVSCRTGVMPSLADTLKALREAEAAVSDWLERHP